MVSWPLLPCPNVRHLELRSGANAVSRASMIAPEERVRSIQPLLSNTWGVRGKLKEISIDWRPGIS
jgi:hypothetical protein